MDMGDVEGGPLRMVFAAIFGDDDDAMPDMDWAELIVLRRYVRENVPHSGHRTEVTALLVAALERFTRD